MNTKYQKIYIKWFENIEYSEQNAIKYNAYLIRVPFI